MKSAKIIHHPQFDGTRFSTVENELEAFRTRDAIYTKDYGLAADGSTDDSAALREAIADTPVGGTLVIQSSTLGIGVTQDGANAWCLGFTKPIRVRGEGPNAIIRPLTSVGNTVNTLALVTDNTFNFNGVTFEGLRLGNPTNGTRKGLHGIYIDTQAANSSFAGLVIQNCAIYTSAAAGNGNAIYHVNNATNNVNGGVYGAVVYQNELQGGVFLNTSGDTIAIYDNVISGSLMGVYAELVTGAGNLKIIGNNITAAAGAIIINKAFAPLVAFNICEQTVTNTEVNNALIDVYGSVASVSNAKVWGNQLQANAGTGSPILLRVDTASGTSIRGNILSTPTAYVPLIITANATNTVIGADNVFSGVSANLTDSGTNTQYEVLSSAYPLTAWTSYTPTVASQTGTITTSSAVGGYKREGKKVSFRAAATITTNGSGATALDIGLPFAPISNQEMATAGFNVTNNYGCAGRIRSGLGTLVRVIKYDGTYPAADGVVISVSGTYETS